MKKGIDVLKDLCSVWFK